MTPERFVTKLLGEAGIEVNGTKPWDVRILNRQVFDRVLDEGSIGFGESYMDGWFECERIDEMLYRAYQIDVNKKVDRKEAFFAGIRAKASTLGSRPRSFEIGQRHYDIGNDLYERMLDRFMIYSCGYWKRAGALDDAQQDKLELICRKLQLEPGLRVLDIGCGFGGFAAYAAERYGVEVVGITVSERQLSRGRELCKGLPVDLRYQDYREVDELFDRIVSIGMFEHVGHKYYPDFFEAAERCLKKDGLFLLHTVGYREEGLANPWFDKRIMPGVAFPALSQILAHTERRFTLEDYHNWEGLHYARTLLAWYSNFEAAWPELQEKYGERFFRMWKLYLQGCAGAFRAERMRVWQLVFAKQPLIGGYAYGHHYPLD